MDCNMLLSNASNRVRTVQLNRGQNPSSPYGFSIRGGCEHGIGVYVSDVEKGSIAFTNGLEVGDQIIGINGLSIESAIHEEVLNLIARSKTTLVLKVKSVGMIPVRSNRAEALSWILSNGIKTASSKSQLIEKQKETIFIDVSKSQKFGCSICKGPVEKPGIFIQAITEGGLAHHNGLRAGDQILLANGRNLNAMAFQEAVEYLKSCKQVELHVIKGAAVELFPSSSALNDAHLEILEDADQIPTTDGGSFHSNGTASVHEAIGEKRNLMGKELSENVTTIMAINNGPEALTVKQMTKNVNNHATIVEPTEEKVSRKLDDVEEFKRQVVYASKLEAKQQEEEVKDLIHSLKYPRESSMTLNGPQSLPSPMEEKRLEVINRGSIDEQQQQRNYIESGDHRAGSVNDENVERLNWETIEKVSPKRKIAVWTPLADIHNSSEALSNMIKEEETKPTIAVDGTSLNGCDGRRHSHDRLIEEFRQVHKRMFTLANEDKHQPSSVETRDFQQQHHNVRKDKKSVSFAVALHIDSVDEEDKNARNISVSLLNEMRRQNTVLSVKPSPHMFVDPAPKVEDADKFKRQAPTNLPPVNNIINRKANSITDSSPAPAKPPEFFFPKNFSQSDSKPKVTIGSYASAKQPQRMAYFQTKVNLVKTENEGTAEIVNNGTSKVVLNGKGSEAKPLKQTQLSLVAKRLAANAQENAKVTDKVVNTASSFSAARAKFMKEEKQKPMTNAKKISYATNASSDSPTDTKKNYNVIQNGHRISIKIPDEQIVIVKK